jgi:hypothetical protein
LVYNSQRWSFTLLAVFFSLELANADQFVSWEGYEIHYSSFSSLIIPAEVARVHDITRAQNRIVTNISIRQGESSVAANISGSARNLLGQIVTLAFSEVLEQDAIYYLANHVINEKDLIKFEIEIHPVNATESYHLNFARQYQ